MNVKNFNKVNTYNARNTRTGETFAVKLVGHKMGAYTFAYVDSGKTFTCKYIVSSAITDNLQALDYCTHMVVNTESAH